MLDTTATEDDSSTGKIEFVQYHQPALEGGDYTIGVTQEVKESGIDEQFPKLERQFSVLGPRFSLNLQDIHAVFPPDGSLGDHSNVLPHIIFNRSTLPWERQADDGSRRDVPWLALLLFDEGELPKENLSILPLKDLVSQSSGSPKWPGIPPEKGQHDDDRITVIDVEKRLLDKILPSSNELAYLAHVRQGTDASGKVGDELGVVIGNRLPKRGGTSTMHLVSLEGRYNNDSFNNQGAGDNDKIRLVSLKSWRFVCLDEKFSFKGLLTNLNREPSTLRLPKSDRAEAELYLAQGKLALPHSLRKGGKTFSWYHGPLATGDNPSPDIALPVRAADELVRYNPANGMFDVSYAAAWELGRLLALQSKHFSVSLFNWKRAHAQRLRQAEQRLIHPHLPAPGQGNNGSNSLDLPQEVKAWFERLSLLQGVPFNYLVPDEHMLPPESIRFFMVDQLWVECLLDGAFSIGRVSTADHERDSQHAQSPAANPYQTVVSGLLLRSDVVAGWPGLLVDAYDTEPASLNEELSETNKLKLLRMERLSANVLLCLFEGEAKTVDIHQTPETLHFGVDPRDHSNEDTQCYKVLRDPDGKELEDTTVDIPWRDGNTRVIAIDELATAIEKKVNEKHANGFEKFTSAQFALEMIEGVQKVRFVIKE